MAKASERQNIFGKKMDVCPRIKSSYAGVVVFRKILYCIGLLLIFWLIGYFWAINWIDRRTYNDFPKRYELTAARFFYKISPSINYEKDAGRVLKFSWLNISTKVYINAKKENYEIISSLKRESIFLVQYFTRNNILIPPNIKYMAFIQILTYLNRVNLFVNYFDPNVDVMLDNVQHDIKLLGLDIQENWYREMMIRSKLIGNIDAYDVNRERFFGIISQQRDVSDIFLKGVVDFYDGILFCVVGQADAALPYLQRAKKELAQYPDYAIAFYKSDLNVLLIGKSMGSGLVCKKYVTDVISLGE